MSERPDPHKSETEGMRPKDMYSNREVVRRFADAEKSNDKYETVARITDLVIENQLDAKPDFSHVADLGAGAHPDTYPRLINRLLNSQGRMDWVEPSPHMLEIAQECNQQYPERRDIIHFIQQDMLAYLDGQDDETLDLCIMKYTLDYLQNIDILFEQLARKLKKGGVLVAVGNLGHQLRCVSTNAHFFYDEKTVARGHLEDGDSFTIKFLAKSGHPEEGYLEGAETTKYYHSPEKIRELAARHNLQIDLLGDWKGAVSEIKRDGETMDQDILILKKVA